ncbi:hypothetical protein EJB05_47444, partial [Eragrostis curvula]
MSPEQGRDRLWRWWSRAAGGASGAARARWTPAPTSRPNCSQRKIKKRATNRRREEEKGVGGGRAGVALGGGNGLRPELAIGISRHSDPGFLTVLLQDDIGGRQILHDGRWVDVASIPGAFIVNMGDLFQFISNDKFSSVEHRVGVKNAGPRVSIACFFSTHFHPASTRMYGPIKELLSEENPPLYRETLVRYYLVQCYNLGLDGREKTALSNLRL